MLRGKSSLQYIFIYDHSFDFVLFYIGASTPEQVEEFVSESAIMIDFDHPNVLGLLGVCFDTDNGLPLIVLPFMSNGDLKTYLQIKRHGTPRGSIPEVCVCVCVREREKIT